MFLNINRFIIQFSKNMKLLIALLGLSFGVSLVAMEKEQKVITNPKELDKWFKNLTAQKDYEIVGSDLSNALSFLDGRYYQAKNFEDNTRLKDFSEKVIAKVKDLSDEELLGNEQLYEQNSSLVFAAIGLFMADLKEEGKKLLSSVGNRKVAFFNPKGPKNTLVLEIFAQTAKTCASPIMSTSLLSDEKQKYSDACNELKKFLKEKIQEQKKKEKQENQKVN